MKLSKRMFLPFFAVLVVFLTPLTGSAAKPKVLSLAELKPGTKAIGFSVFQGVEPEKFDVVLGKAFAELGNPYIYARISGGPLETPLEQTGPVSGVSGSPIFIGCTAYEECIDRGVLVGALSRGVGQMPLGGMNAAITPAERMLGASSNGYTATQSLLLSGLSANRMAQIPLGGRTQTLGGSLPEHVLPSFLANQNASGNETGNAPAKLKPGSMIAIFLAYGDIPIASWGTVTWVDGDRIYAFGHPFHGKGAVRYPFAHISVAATIQNPLEPYKMMGNVVGNWGVITLDGATEVEGVMGQTMQGIPLQTTLQIGTQSFALHEEVTPDTPITDAILLQMPAFWVNRIAGDVKSMSLGYQIRIVLAGEPEILLQNLIGAAFKQNPVGKLSAVLAGVFGGLNASGFPYAIESVRLDLNLAADAALWQKEKVFLSKTEGNQC